MAQTVWISGKSGSPIVDSEGNALAVVKESSANYVLAMDLSRLENLSRSRPPCAAPLSHCIFKARGELLRLAKAGDTRAQRELFLAADGAQEYYDRFLDTLRLHEKGWTSEDMEKIFYSASREKMDILAIRINRYNEAEDVTLFLSSYLKRKENGRPVSAYILYHTCNILGGYHINKESWQSIQPVILECFAELADQGFALGQRVLGLALLSLSDMEEKPRQTAEAYKWLGSAALQGDMTACKIVRELMDLASGLKTWRRESLPLQQFTEAFQKACEA